MIALPFVTATTDYLNVYGEELQSCSYDGMARTGYTRTGYCVDQNDDTGSHHICIDLSSNVVDNDDGGADDGVVGNFCDVTGQNDWCSSYMTCHENYDNNNNNNNDSDDDGNNEAETCQVQNWCVCQWAFASYLEAAGGCDAIQDIVCESINMQAAVAYYNAKNEYGDALNCLIERCGIDETDLAEYAQRMKQTNGGRNLWLFALEGLIGAVVIGAAAGICAILLRKKRYRQEQKGGTKLPESDFVPMNETSRVT